MSRTAPPVVELHAAEKVFDGGVRGLAPISLTVEPGEFVTLIGPSGCGKSTLLRLIARLIAPSRGAIQWWGGGFERVGDDGHRLAFVFQEPTLMAWASVATNVRLPLDLAGEPRAAGQSRAVAALAQVGLADRARSMPRHLSGGQRMRVSIARALVTNPDLLLMDEPFGALDEISRNKLDADLLALSAQHALTTIFVTHSISEAVFLSTRVIVMSAQPGRIFADYAIQEPQPRGDEFRFSDRFAAQARELSDLLKQASGANGEIP